MDHKAAQTKMINKPYRRFRNPNKKSQPATTALSYICFELPNGLIHNLRLAKDIVVGRGTNPDSNTVKVDLDNVGGSNNGVSRNHAYVQLIDGCVSVRDLNSTNGTFLNGAELYPMRNYALENGDVLTLGKVQLKINFSHGKH